MVSLSKTCRQTAIGEFESFVSMSQDYVIKYELTECGYWLQYHASYFDEWVTLGYALSLPGQRLK